MSANPHEDIYIKYGLLRAAAKVAIMKLHDDKDAMRAQWLLEAAIRNQWDDVKNTIHMHGKKLSEAQDEANATD